MREDEYYSSRRDDGTDDDGPAPETEEEELLWFRNKRDASRALRILEAEEEAVRELGYEPRYPAEYYIKEAPAPADGSLRKGRYNKDQNDPVIIMLFNWGEARRKARKALGWSKKKFKRRRKRLIGHI